MADKVYTRDLFKRDWGERFAKVCRNLKSEAKLSTGCIGWRRYTPCSVILAIYNSIRRCHELEALVTRDDKMQ